MIEGDKIDNDCDGEIDEEQSDGKGEVYLTSNTFFDEY